MKRSHSTRALGSAPWREAGRFTAWLLVCLLLVLAPLPARAKSSKDLGYRYNTVWSSAIRFIRADRSYEIKDKDKDNGFILFVYPGSGAVKECAGSLELLKVRAGNGAPEIRVQVSIQHQPSYIEIHFLDTLEQKLRDEQGPPPPQRTGKQEEQKKKEEEERKKEQQKKEEHKPGQAG